MKAVIRLEMIGDYPSRIFRAAGDFQPKPWVARITGFDPKFGYKREFVRSWQDWSRANSKGTRGVFHYYPLDDGVYEVNERLSWQNIRRYFILAERGDYWEIEQQEVDEWLRNTSSASTS